MLGQCFTQSRRQGHRSTRSRIDGDMDRRHSSKRLAFLIRHFRVQIDVIVTKFLGKFLQPLVDVDHFGVVLGEVAASGQHGLDVPQIAEALGMKANAVHQALFRAHEKLRENLG